MAKDDKFNHYLGPLFADAYTKENKFTVEFLAVGDDFPDAILKRTDNSEKFGVEFVELLLSFTRSEDAYFKKYRIEFYKVLEPLRSKLAGFRIQLQPAHTLIEKPRPITLPKISSEEGKSIIKEFGELFASRLDVLISPQGAAIRFHKIQTEFPTLTTFYNAVLMTPILESYPGRPSPLDPFIDTPVTYYQEGEIYESVKMALLVKSTKGASYKTDILVVHTFPVDPLIYGTIGIHRNEILQHAARFLGEGSPVCENFKEVWFFNKIICDGRQLDRIK